MPAKTMLFVLTGIMFATGAASAETFSLRCNNPAQGDNDAAPELFSVDTANNTITYFWNSQALVYPAQITATAIDFAKHVSSPNGQFTENVHIDRGTGQLTNSAGYTLLCHKVQGF